MNALEVLKAARERIAVPERWTQGCAARTSSGEPRFTGDPDAARWCAIGSIFHDHPYLTAATDAYAAVVDVVKGNLSEFNDSHTHSEVLAAFDRAIAKLESEMPGGKR
jgi:hypothetical protein